MFSNLFIHYLFHYNKETPAEIPLSQKHVNNPDLSNVEEIGFTDLMPGGKSSFCSRLDWIEVYGKPVKH